MPDSALQTLIDLRDHVACWVSDARVLGNIKACDAITAMNAGIAAITTSEIEDGQLIGHTSCACCGARLEIVHGDEPGMIGNLYDPDAQDTQPQRGAGKAGGGGDD